MALANAINMYGLRSAQPAAGPENNGCFYRVTDEGDIVEQSDGATWTEIAGGGGAGTVTHTGALTASALVVGNGTDDIKVLASLGTTTTVLHGNAAGLPTFGAVALGTDISGLGTGVATALAINVGSAGAIGAFQFIEEQTPSGVGTITFSSLGTFTHLEIRFSAASTQSATATSLLIRFNADSGNNYDTQQNAGSGTTPTAAEALAAANGFIGAVTGATGPANGAGVGSIHIYDYRGTTFFKGWTSESTYRDTTASGGTKATQGDGDWRNTAAITSVTLLLNSGNYVAGSKFTLYGLR